MRTQDQSSGFRMEIATRGEPSMASPFVQTFQDADSRLIAVFQAWPRPILREFCFWPVSAMSSADRFRGGFIDTKASRTVDSP